MINIAIFASGNGSNALRLIEYFKNHSSIQISCVFTNNPSAGVIQKAKENAVPCLLFNKVQFFEGNAILASLSKYQIDYIVLAGFLLLVPKNVISTYSNKIINIHPSLLPKYGGKGMYGDHVHKAVLANKEIETGVTVHLVNEEFDKGKIVGFEKIVISKNETLESLKQKVHEAEHRILPHIVEKIVLERD